MKLPSVDNDKPQSVREKFQSRKYKVVWFWNALSFLAVAIQSGLSFAGVEIKLPLEIIIGIAGVLNAAYLGVNLLEKKFIQDIPVAGSVAPVTPTAPTTAAKK